MITLFVTSYPAVMKLMIHAVQLKYLNFSPRHLPPKQLNCHTAHTARLQLHHMYIL